MRLNYWGGEPLLNVQLPEFLELTRKYYPQSEIYVGTNGLLIPKCDTRVLQKMRELEIYFMISYYPVVENIKENIIERLEKEEIAYVFTEKITDFYNVRMKTPRSDKQKSHTSCATRNGRCFTLREGKLNPCVIAYVRMLNEKFDAGFQITNEDEFELQKEKDGWRLAEKLHDAIPFCAYCGTPEVFKWKGGCKQDTLEDYMILNEDAHVIQ